MSDEEAYIYAADIYCADCGEDIRRRLKAEGEQPENAEDETTFDSDEFPKGPYPDGGGEADCPQHCGNHANCLNPTIIGEQKCGHFLENPLTTDGVKYVLESQIESHNEVTQFWMDHYEEEIKSYLQSNPNHPYHRWLLECTLQEIVNRVRRNLSCEDEGEGDDPTADALEWILNEVAERHGIHAAESEEETD